MGSIEAVRYSFCSACGQRWPDNATWPRRCANCATREYRNPTPVCVVLLPVETGLLVIRREVEPQVGHLALPGGYIDWHETWQAGGARELREETGIDIADDELTLFEAVSSVKRGIIAIFGLARPRKASDLPAFHPNAETSGWQILLAPQPLAFKSHTSAVADWFAQQHPRT